MSPGKPSAMAVLTLTRQGRGAKRVHPDISATAFTGGMLACFWAKLFSRCRVARPDWRRFNLYGSGIESRAQASKQTRTGMSPGRNIVPHVAAYHLCFGEIA